MDPWEWDDEYPEEMYGKYFLEDVNAIVGIDIAKANHDKVKRDNAK